MKKLALLSSIFNHAIAAIVIAVAGLWYGIVTYGLVTPQAVYDAISAGLPMPVLLLSFLFAFAVFVLVAHYLFHYSKIGGKKSSAILRSGFWLCYLFGSSVMFYGGVLLSTLNPMLALPRLVESLVVSGTAVEVISLVLCLISAGLFTLANRWLSPSLHTGK